MIVNKILTICIIVILIISAIFIGGPLKNNIEIINAIISIIAILYVIWKTKKENKKIITNKIDIFVLIFMFSSCIPLIFNTYISLDSTVLSLYQTISATAIYFLSKQIKLETNNKYNFIEFGIILSSLIVFIIGIDNLTSNVFIKKLHEQRENITKSILWNACILLYSRYRTYKIKSNNFVLCSIFHTLPYLYERKKQKAGSNVRFNCNWYRNYSLYSFI